MWIATATSHLPPYHLPDAIGQARANHQIFHRATFNGFCLCAYIRDTDPLFCATCGINCSNETEGNHVFSGTSASLLWRPRSCSLHLSLLSSHSKIPCRPHTPSYPLQYSLYPLHSSATCQQSRLQSRPQITFAPRGSQLHLAVIQNPFLYSMHCIQYLCSAVKSQGK